MYSFLSVLTGIVLAVMVAVNGELSGCCGVFVSSVIIHIVGTLFALVLLIVAREKISVSRGIPKWYYLGGMIGVLTTVFQNMAIHHISITSVVALGLLGQSVMSLLIDGLGLFGMKKIPFRKTHLISFGFALLGIGMMWDGTALHSAVAIVCSLGAGISVVVSRMINARLSEATSALQGAFMNHLVGLLVLVLVSGFAANGITHAGEGLGRPWMYAGGMLGVLVVMLCNYTVPRISAFKITILTFTGQVFTGILLDLLIKKSYSDVSFWSGCVIAAGIMLSKVAEPGKANPE